MAPRRGKVNKLDYKRLSPSDVVCPICRNILIKPVTLPCSHGFCWSCFETTSQNSNLVCPVCRVRIGSWLRTATKSKKFVNEELWRAIQDMFPQHVRPRLKAISENTVKEKIGSDEKLKRKRDNSSKTNETETSKPQATASLANNQTALRVSLLNNFATKEYTCRILCQNGEVRDGATKLVGESHKKNKRIQTIVESERLNDRSNSIESECLYFKPIDYKHNPPSEGLAPIKVPTRKPNVNTNIKILAPCGQNRININPQVSAFVSLFTSEIVKEKPVGCKKENVVGQEPVTPPKRKLERTDRYKKKLKSNHKAVESNERIMDDFKYSLLNNNNKKTSNVRVKNLVSAKNLAKKLQEKADFELATKLQQTYNQYSKYLTRSSVLKVG